jgi:hypothetical protein
VLNLVVHIITTGLSRVKTHYFLVYLKFPSEKVITSVISIIRDAVYSAENVSEEKKSPPFSLKDN